MSVMLIWFVSAWVTKQRWATKQQSLFLKLQAWLRRLEICRNRYFAPTHSTRSFKSSCTSSTILYLTANVYDSPFPALVVIFSFPVFFKLSPNNTFSRKAYALIRLTFMLNGTLRNRLNDNQIRPRIFVRPYIS